MLGSMSEFYAFQRFVLCDGVIKDVPIEVAGETLVDTWISGVSKRALSVRDTRKLLKDNKIGRHPESGAAGKDTT